MPSTRWQSGHWCSTSLHGRQQKGIRQQKNGPPKTKMRQQESQVSLPLWWFTFVTTGRLQVGQKICWEREDKVDGCWMTTVVWVGTPEEYCACARVMVETLKNAAKDLNNDNLTENRMSDNDLMDSPRWCCNSTGCCNKYVCLFWAI